MERAGYDTPNSSDPLAVIAPDYGYQVGAAGQRYPVDAYAVRACRLARPAAVLPEVLSKLDQAQKRRFLGEYSRAPSGTNALAAVSAVPDAGAPAAAPACTGADENADCDREPIDFQVSEFERGVTKAADAWVRPDSAQHGCAEVASGVSIRGDISFAYINDGSGSRGPYSHTQFHSGPLEQHGHSCVVAPMSGRHRRQRDHVQGTLHTPPAWSTISW